MTRPQEGFAGLPYDRQPTTPGTNAAPVSVSVEYRVVCADGSDGLHFSERGPADEWRRIWDRSDRHPHCGPHRVEQATVTRSEWRPA